MEYAVNKWSVDGKNWLLDRRMDDAKLIKQFVRTTSHHTTVRTTATPPFRGTKTASADISRPSKFRTVVRFGPFDPAGAAAVRVSP